MINTSDIIKQVVDRGYTGIQDNLEAQYLFAQSVYAFNHGLKFYLDCLAWTDHVNMSNYTSYPLLKMIDYIDGQLLVSGKQGFMR